MITYQELLATPEYWTTKIQLDLYNMLKDYIEANHLTRTELASKLGVTKGYISQVLNGDFDHRMSKFVDLSLAVGMIPQVSYIPVDKIFAKESATGVTIDSIAETDIKIPEQMRSFSAIASPMISNMNEDNAYSLPSVLQIAA